MTLRPSFRPDDAEQEHEYEDTTTVRLNYGGYHPFEMIERDRIRLSSRLRDLDLKRDSGNFNSNSYTSSEEKFRTASSRDYEPIRIVLKLHGLDNTTIEANGDGEEEGEGDDSGSNQQPLAESSNGGSGTGSGGEGGGGGGGVVPIR